MTIEDVLHTPEIEAQLAKEERGRRIVAKVKVNKRFMQGVRRGFESQQRGEGVRFEDVKSPDA